MRVVVTRPEGRGRDFTARLEGLGHEVAHVPLTRILDGDPFPDPSPFDGVLFTSVAAVERAPACASWPRVGAVGPKTAAALEARGIEVDVTGGAGGEELGRLWGPAAGQRLLLPRAADPHPGLEDVLRAAGAEVVGVAVYRTEPVSDLDPETLEQLERADLVCFFAPSQVDAFLALRVAKGTGTGARLWGHGAATAAALKGLEGYLDALEDVL